MAVGKWIGSVNTDRKNFGKSFEEDRKEFRNSITKLADEIRADIKKILLRLTPTIDSKSPMSLSELGEKVSREIDAPGWVRDLAPRFLDEVKGKSRYFIQELCMDFFVSKYKPSDDQKYLLEDCAFKYGIDVDSVLRVLGLELRDRLLKLLDE